MTTGVLISSLSIKSVTSKPKYLLLLNESSSTALIEQCSTFIFMPNPKAREKDYIEGFHLTEREFDLINLIIKHPA
jgi:type IV secretory pathway VirB4 component